MEKLINKFGIRESDVTSFVKYVAECKNVEDAKIEILGTGDCSEGSTGLILYINVNGKINNEKITYNLVMKHGLTKKVQRDILPYNLLYETENFIYSTVAPKFRSMLKRKRLADMLPLANYYGAKFMKDREMIIIENVTPKGYVLHDIRKSIGLDQIKLILKAYAKWHSLSIAYKLENPEDWEHLMTKLSEYRHKIYFDPGFELANTFNQRMCDILKEAGAQKLLDKVKHYVNTSMLRMSIKCDQYAVVVHEDCWNNNYLFRYENDRPVDVMLLDWQLSGVSHLEIDLATFLFSTIASDDLPKIPSLLDYYYHQFTEYMEKFGYRIEKVYPKSVFLDHWKEYAKYGTIRIPFIYTKCVVNKEDLSNIGSVADKNEFNFNEIYEISSDKEVSEKIVKLLSYMDDNELL